MQEINPCIYECGQLWEGINNLSDLSDALSIRTARDLPARPAASFPSGGDYEASDPHLSLHAHAAALLHAHGREFHLAVFSEESTSRRLYRVFAQVEKYSKDWDQWTGASAQAMAEMVSSSRSTLAKDRFAVSSIPVRVELVQPDSQLNGNTPSEGAHILESLMQLLLKI